MEVAEKPRMKVADMPSNKLVEIFIQLRDRRAQRKAAYENEDADDKAKQEKIEGILMVKFAEDGVESVKTAAGTAYKKVTTGASMADKDMFMDFVRKNSAWDMLTSHVAKDAIAAWKEENDDLPPGINWFEKITIGVRRS
jgi:hypothetical protein